MGYLTISTIANDAHMQERLRACHAQETDGVDSVEWAWGNRYDWAAAPGWDAAWDSALANDIAEPGKDESVITDAMILAQVQSMLGPS
jgi:hypothetical protein